MPCNIGYKAVNVIVIPEPITQELKAEIDAKIDADLLDKLGNEDPEFMDWLNELDKKPLLEEALRRALKKVGADGVKFSIASNGALEGKDSFTDARSKRKVEETIAKVSERWQFEILGIVVELMDYEVKITQNGNEFVLEAEESGQSHPCDYIKVTKKDGNSTLTFEHFKSRKALEIEVAKFLSLAHKLGVKIKLGDLNISEGDKFPGQTHSHAHGHLHGHDHDKEE